jgi:hypothetical protein
MELLNKIQKELKAPKGQRNTFGNYNYRSCEDILEAVKPLLGDGTLTISDEMVILGTPQVGIQKSTEKDGTVHENEIDIGSRFYVKATATLTCGKESVTAVGWARESFNKKGMDESQITGATSSYARKYALNGLFAIDDAKDADSTNKHGKDEKPKVDILQKLVDRLAKDKVILTKEEVLEIMELSETCNGKDAKFKTNYIKTKGVEKAAEFIRGKVK